MNEIDCSKQPLARVITRNPDPAQWANAPLLVLTACDSAYLGDAMALARSMDEFSGQHHLMVHVVNPSDDDIARLKQLAESLESINLHISSEKIQLPPSVSAPAYYASARFIRMAELLQSESPVPVLALDSDSLAVGTLTLDFSDKTETEICLRRRDLKDEVAEHMKVAAGAVWARNTPNAARFMRVVADDLIDSFRAGTSGWFIDQLVLIKHVQAETAGAKVRNMKSKFLDWEMLDDAVFWTGKGDRKYLDIRYLLLRESFDEDHARRDAARSLHSWVSSRVPQKQRKKVDRRLRQSLSRRPRIRTAIYMPRLDLPWKLAGMHKDGRAPAPSEDTIELRLWWKRFAMELARTLTGYGADPILMEIPAWDITPERIDGEGVDLAFIPHRCHLDFGPTDTIRRFYMQEYFRPVFVVDSQGWSAASSVYPIDVNELPPAVLGAWDDYHYAFKSGNLRSKFGQSVSATRAELQARGEIPIGPYIFYPLQVPHDQSIRYFSDVNQDQALEAVHDLAMRTGLKLVLKEHPANGPAMKPYRERYTSEMVTWSEANLHDLLRHSTGVVTINSGVGFEALLAGKPIVCLGRAEYDTAVHFASPDALYDVWHDALNEAEEDRMRRYGRFVDWFLGRYAIDLSRPYAGRYTMSNMVQDAVADVMRRRELRT